MLESVVWARRVKGWRWEKHLGVHGGGSGLPALSLPPCLSSQVSPCCLLSPGALSSTSMRTKGEFPALMHQCAEVPILKPYGNPWPLGCWAMTC